MNEDEIAMVSISVPTKKMDALQIPEESEEVQPDSGNSFKI